MGQVEITTEGRVALVRFDRGTRANALSFSLMEELIAAARALEDDVTLCAVILAGRPDGFSMGFDLKDPGLAALKDAPLAERRRAVGLGRRMCAAWAGLEPLTIAAIDGWCVGGGVALAAACDLRGLSEDAMVYAPEIERGFNMSWGSIPRLVNLIGPARTKRLCILSERLNARQAESWGFADDVAPTGEEAARRLAARAEQAPPTALRMIKRATDAYAGALAGAASHADLDQFALTQLGDEHEQALAAFLNR